MTDAQRPSSDRGKTIESWADAHVLLIASFCLALVYSTAVLAFSWSRPILDAHPFRQTQTALTTYWLNHGGDWVAYETPVVGRPWTIPFEFPLYQWIVALVARLGVPLDSAGRLVSWTFFIGCLPLAVSIIRRNGGDLAFALIFCTLFLFSPIYVFWSRSFMIESCALFFSLAFVAALGVVLADAKDGSDPRRSWLPIGAMTVCATMAALVKITTFFSFSLAGALMTAVALFQSWHLREPFRRQLRIAWPPLIAVIVAMAALKLWLGFTDDLKAGGVITQGMTTAANHDWTLGQARLRDSDFWSFVVLKRSLTDTIGSNVLFYLLPLSAAFSRRSRLPILAGISLFVASFLAFPNLHSNHRYYQYANAVFAIFALAGALWGLGGLSGTMTARPRKIVIWSLVIVFLLTIAVETTGFLGGYWLQILSEPQASRTLSVAKVIRQTTNPKDVVLVFGFDWSSEVAYYSERRTVAFPRWAATSIPSSPQEFGRFVGNSHVGAIVDCPDPEYGASRSRIDQLESAYTAQQVGACKVFSTLRRST